MSRGPTYYESKGACIYCGATGVKLTDEHIVPYALGGTHVLRGASCLPCADITKKFEQHVARDLWGDARTSFNATTRRKRERKSHLVMNDPEQGALSIPRNEFPAGLTFYKMCPPGFLQGMPEDVDLSGTWQMVVVDDDQRRAEFLKKHPDRKVVLKFRHVPQSYGQLLAKIGYGQVLTSLDPGDFRPICLPYIMGEKTNISWVVGGVPGDPDPEPDNGYSLTTYAMVMPARVILMARVRIYANVHSPAYDVVVGDVVGADQIDRVLKKLDTA